MTKAKKKSGGSDYILLDRSGSMADRWKEALTSVNSYVKELEKGVNVTLAMFDCQNGLKLDVIRNSVPSEQWTPVSETEAYPRGMTPLYDAIGRIVALAEAAGDEKVVIVVMTDGYENASREMTQPGAKAALDRCRAKNWQVVFLGSDFDAITQAASVGTGHGQTINTVAHNHVATMDMLAGKSKAYRASGQSVSFSDEDRVIALGKKKK